MDSIYYMRDDHLFAKLPTDDVEKFIHAIREQFSGGYKYGMLCGGDDCPMLHAHGKWEEFEPAAREWFRRQFQEMP